MRSSSRGSRRIWSGLLAGGVKPQAVALGAWGSPERWARVAQGLVRPLPFAGAFADAWRAGRFAAPWSVATPAGPSQFLKR